MKSPSPSKQKNSSPKKSSPKKSSPKKPSRKVLPIQRYTKVTRNKLDDQPAVHTNKGVSRVPWEPEATLKYDASPIVPRTFSLNFKDWSKTKKDSLSKSSQQSSENDQSDTISKPIKTKIKSVKKRIEKDTVDNSYKEANTSNSLLALDEWLTSDQVNIEVTEPTKSSSKSKQRSKVEFIPAHQSPEMVSPSKRRRSKELNKINSPTKRKHPKMAAPESESEPEPELEADPIPEFHFDADDLGMFDTDTQIIHSDDLVVKPKSISKRQKSTTLSEPSLSPKTSVSVLELAELAQRLAKAKETTVELESQLVAKKSQLKPNPPLTENISNDYSSELKQAQVNLHLIQTALAQLRREKDENILTLFHHRHACSDQQIKLNPIDNWSYETLDKMTQSYFQLYQRSTQLVIRDDACSPTDERNLTSRYGNVIPLEKFKCSQTGPLGVHHFNLYLIQDGDTKANATLLGYEPILPSQPGDMSWKELPEYFRDFILFDKDQGVNFIRRLLFVSQNRYTV